MVSGATMSLVPLPERRVALTSMSAAERLEMVENLWAPLVFDEETGESWRDESCGLISREQAIALLSVE